MQGFLKDIQEKLAQKSNPTIKDILIWRFALLKENPLLTVFHRQNDMKQLFFRFRDSNLSLFNLPAQNDMYKKEFIQGGLDYVTSRWILNGMEEYPNEMAEKVLSFINKNL